MKFDPSQLVISTFVFICGTGFGLYWAAKGSTAPGPVATAQAQAHIEVQKPFIHDLRIVDESNIWMRGCYKGWSMIRWNAADEAWIYELNAVGHPIKCDHAGETDQ